MNYEEIKAKFEDRENKHKLILACCFVLVFLVGYGSGSYVKETKKTKLKAQVNYNTNIVKNPDPAGGAATEQKKLDMQPAAAGDSPQEPCIVKGNLSSSGKKIYHVEGGAFYKTVKPEQCFASEELAKAAGFVKSSR